MEYLRVAGATINQTPLDFKGNAGRLREVLRAARSSGVQLLVLPELSIPGYGCEDAFFSGEVSKRSEIELLGLLPETQGMTVVFGLPVIYEGGLYNCAVVVQDTKILGINPKRVLAREGVHYEPRWFSPWAFGRLGEKLIGSHKVPFGDTIYQLGPMGMAIELCEEAWGSIPAAAMVADLVHLVVNPSASHFALGKYQKREQLVANSSRAMHATYLYTNLLGCEAGRLIYDGGVLIADKGVMVARGPRFGFVDGSVTYHDIVPEAATTEKIKHRSVYLEGGFTSGSPQQSPPVHRIQGQDPRIAKSPPSRGLGEGLATGKNKKTPYRVECHRGESLVVGSEKIPTDPESEFLGAEMLGLFDYVRKSGHKGFVISLSGGVDSSTCAVLVAHMLAGALKELGPLELSVRLGWEEGWSKGLDSSDPRLWMQRLLCCLYQKTAQSGPVTENAARQLALALGCGFYVADVEAVVQSYVQGAEAALGAKLSWDQHDIALQNIQARARAPMPWLLANVRQSLFLTTSNRSEAAVGYATMDGDTAGGLAPLAGIDKPFLRRWLRWVAVAEGLPFGPLPVLELVNVQAPTAELRPTSSGVGTGAGPEQTDEADLMPYPVLERIERYFVRDRLGPADICQLLSRDFREVDGRQLSDWVEKFMKLWSRSQWKRERIAPGFHLDEISLDPKSYCRYPILNGILGTSYT